MQRALVLYVLWVSHFKIYLFQISESIMNVKFQLYKQRTEIAKKDYLKKLAVYRARQISQVDKANVACIYVQVPLEGKYVGWRFVLRSGNSPCCVEMENFREFILECNNRAGKRRIVKDESNGFNQLIKHNAGSVHCNGWSDPCKFDSTLSILDELLILLHPSAVRTIESVEITLSSCLPSHSREVSNLCSTVPFSSIHQQLMWQRRKCTIFPLRPPESLPLSATLTSCKPGRSGKVTHLYHIYYILE